MLTVLLNALVPIFGGLLLGYVAGRRGSMDGGNVRNLIVFVMNIAVPCALVSIIIGTPWAVLESQAVTALAITLVFAGLYAACYFWARGSLGMSIADSAVLALTIGFPNAAAVALPLLSDAFGSHAAVPAALSLAIGSVTVSPVTLALLEAQRDSPKEAIPLVAVLRSVPRAFGRPVVWAPLAGLLCVALHIRFQATSKARSSRWAMLLLGLRWSLQGSSPRPNTSGSKGACFLRRWPSCFCSPS
jgi:malonate transporter and related proteins